MLGTGGRTAGHRWAELVGGTAGHSWVTLLGTGGRSCVGGTAGHRWVALLGTGGWSWWVALLGTDHQGTDHQCPEPLVLGSTFLTI
ncbi:unnamed protein product [Staurois parvus]|uniref:Uncharacterized protein n=1 Tax=Staurois parvus TaxID=386267 RepID=A0ABN9AQJ1_9NEOB|nr:unnamed protein product [Staurois parvus]